MSVSSSRKPLRGAFPSLTILGDGKVSSLQFSTILIHLSTNGRVATVTSRIDVYVSASAFSNSAVLVADADDFKGDLNNGDKVVCETGRIMLMKSNEQELQDSDAGQYYRRMVGRRARAGRCACRDSLSRMWACLVYASPFFMINCSLSSSRMTPMVQGYCLGSIPALYTPSFSAVDRTMLKGAICT